MSGTGRNLVVVIGVYMLAKAVLNLILSFGISGILSVLIAIAAAVLLLQRIPYIQYIVAVYLALLFLVHIFANISGLPGTLLYLIEGLLDVASAAVLVFEKNVKAFFKKEG